MSHFQVLRLAWRYDTMDIGYVKSHKRNNKSSDERHFRGPNKTNHIFTVQPSPDRGA